MVLKALKTTKNFFYKGASQSFPWDLWTYIYVEAWCLVAGVLNVVGTTCLFIGNIQVGRKLHRRLIHNILASPMRFFDTTPSGRILNRFGKDIDTIDAVIAQILHYVLYCFLDICCMVIVIGMSLTWILVVLGPLAIFYIVVQVREHCFEQYFSRIVSFKKQLLSCLGYTNWSRNVIWSTSCVWK